MGILFSTFTAFASPPKFVYRYDSRPPAEIFKSGFSATSPVHGINDPLVHSFGHDYLDNKPSPVTHSCLLEQHDCPWNTSLLFIQNKSHIKLLWYE
ncbi:hypothetical protein ACEUAY_21550 [Aeromonas veronii]